MRLLSTEVVLFSTRGRAHTLKTRNLDHTGGCGQGEGASHSYILNLSDIKFEFATFQLSLFVYGWLLLGCVVM